MSFDPVLHVLAGPNGAGKTTFYERVLQPATGLPFVNADVIAARRWPHAAAMHGHEAAQLAAAERARRIADRRSFVAETVFSHESKLQLIRDANDAGFHVTLHVVLIPEELAVARVVDRVANGGHHVPENKIRERYRRLWSLIAEAITLAEQAIVYDNTTATSPFRLVATFVDGRPVDQPTWPKWTPSELTDLTRD